MVQYSIVTPQGTKSEGLNCTDVYTLASLTDDNVEDMLRLQVGQSIQAADGTHIERQR